MDREKLFLTPEQKMEWSNKILKMFEDNNIGFENGPSILVTCFGMFMRNVAMDDRFDYHDKQAYLKNMSSLLVDINGYQFDLKNWLVQNLNSKIANDDLK